MMTRHSIRPSPGLLFLVLAAVSILPAAPLPGAEVFKPLRTATPPAIDGALDDPVWREAPSVSDFKIFIPDFGKDLSERTVGYIAYDAENLYFAFKCYDREPGKIKAAVAARDTIRPDDFVCINLDTFNDQQSLYALYVNPLGIQTDSRFASGQEDFSVDIVWYSAGRLDPDGYSVEIRLPFKSIRYARKERVEMSILFERRISRRAEHGSYPPLDPAQGFFFLTQMMPFELRDIKTYTLLEAIPAFTYSQKYSQDGGALRRDDPLRDFSLTGKYGLTSQLILDGTWNPDFSQVEADAGQVDVNLRYDLYFPEKRPFFLEGSEMFLLAGSSGEDPLQSVVYTRRIIDPRAGFKLSGKLGRKDTLASIFALDESPSFDLGSGSDRKYAGFGILRYKRALTEDSYVGAFLTDREYTDEFNRVAGLDGQVRLTKSSMLGFHGFGSWTKRPETAGTAAGSALGLDYLFDTRSLWINLGFHDISRDFGTDTGYLMRNGLAGLRALIEPRFYPQSKVFRRISCYAFANVLQDLPSDLVETQDGLGLEVLLPGSTRVALRGGYATEIFLGRRFDISYGFAQVTSQVTKEFYILSAFTRGGAIRYTDDPFQGYGSRAKTSIIYQPSEKFRTTFSLTYSDLYRRSTEEKVFDYTILRGLVSYQVNKYLFFRGIAEYNSYRKSLLTDFLASFTYIPGTVVQLGYGSLYNKLRWEDGLYREDDRFLEMQRGLFFKVSYLWRL